MERKLNLINNIIGLMGALYTLLLFVIVIIFKEKAKQILKTAIPIFVLLAVIFILALLGWGYLKKKFEQLERIEEKIKRLEEHQKLDTRFRKIEEKLINQGHILNSTMGKTNRLPVLGKKGNAVLWTILALLLVALLLWLVWFSSTI